MSKLCYPMKLVLSFHVSLMFGMNYVSVFVEFENEKDAAGLKCVGGVSNTTGIAVSLDMVFEVLKSILWLESLYSV